MHVECHSCGFDNDLPGAVGRRDTCAQCGADLHCCLGCRFFDDSAWGVCREGVPEQPRSRDQANFCDAFVAGGRKREKGGGRDDAMAAFEALFKKR